MAAVDYFLKIDGITGESSDSKHKEEIELTSFSWGAANSTTHLAAGGGAGAGKVTLQDFNFTALSSKASPQLFASTVSGKLAKTAVLTARKAGGNDNPVEFLKITMSTVLVSFYKEQGPNTDTPPADEVGLLFKKVVFEFIPQSPTGGVTTGTTASFDLTRNNSA